MTARILIDYISYYSYSDMRKEKFDFLDKWSNSEKKWTLFEILELYDTSLPHNPDLPPHFCLSRILVTIYS